MKDFLWWVVCKMWSPIIPGIVSFCCGIYAVWLAFSRFGADGLWPKVWIVVAFIAGQGLPMALFYILDRFFGKYFENNYHPPKARDPFYDRTDIS